MDKLIVILGPTATGKTKLAVKLASKFNGEIISADSRQVYKGMNIGTGKDLNEYKPKNLKPITYHLINIVQPTTRFNVAKFKTRAERIIKDITSRNKIPFLVGGTGLYISALIKNYQFPKQTKPKYDTLQLGLTFPKDILDKRIDERVDKMMKMGLVKEVKKLIKKYGRNSAPLHTIGYQEIMDYLQSVETQDFASLQKIIDLIKIHTRQFAKRQMTWFKRDKRIKWIKKQPQAEKLIRRFLEK